MFARRTFFQLALGAAGARLLQTSPPRENSPIVDGLGEVRVEYDAALVDEIRASGLRACVVTLGNPAVHGPEAWDSVREEHAAYEGHIRNNPDRLLKATSSSGIAEAAASQRIALLYYLQNASPIQENLEVLATLGQWGVRVIQLTYNTRNLLGDGCLERTNAGLSKFGLEVVERMNVLDIVVDVSHCGETTTLEGIQHSKKPSAITHSGCKAVYDHPRNKSDEALRTLAKRGGVVGIYQINPYLGPRERNTLDDYLAHVDHAVKVAGIEHVGIGSDREYRSIPDTPEEKQKLIEELSRLRPVTAATFRWPFFISELNHPRRMETIARALERRSYSSAQRDKIMGGNWMRFFRDTIG